jgi:outer membrane lipoprotein-sorting protein
MRRKLLILFAVFFMISTMISGCDKKSENPNEVTNFLKDLSGYSTDFTMEFKNDKQTLNYEGKQFYSKTLGYRMELGQDRIFIYKNDKIYVNDVKSGLKYTTDQEFDYLYRISFIKEYLKMLYTNEEIKYDFKDVNGIKYQLIELIVPGGNRETSKAVMYVNMKNNFPEKVLIYDINNNEKIKITYSNFVANPELSEDLFKV